MCNNLFVAQHLQGVPLYEWTGWVKSNWIACLVWASYMNPRSMLQFIHFWYCRILWLYYER